MSVPITKIAPQSQSQRAKAVIGALREGGPAIIAEGRDANSFLHLVAAGRCIEAGVVNRMANEARGVVFLALSRQQAERLGLRRLGPANPKRWSWGVSASIEARDGVDTGISAMDRARTIAVASSMSATPDDVVSPGHVFPIIAHSGGLLSWQAVAEAAVEAVELAGCGEAAALCHILTDLGDAATWGDLPTLTALRGLPVATISDLLVFRHSEGDSLEQAFACAFQ
ncbi:hypothetical protein GCM10009087_48720 [Sphingomonas oligophenolica]|uniref:3,4-dihydroxy-2-butanone 4-phosphate synthase n=1 Tax=Sphingomonas oligophenolica TaxID=301154 RepID=A0ABU9YBT0_9SPHN